MMVKQIEIKIRATKMGKRIVSDERYRIVAAAALGLSINLLYAFYHGTLVLLTDHYGLLRCAPIIPF